MQKNLPISKEIISKLQKILRPFILRRLKRDVEKTVAEEARIYHQMPALPKAEVFV